MLLFQGTLYISEGRLCWSGESGTGFSLEYPAIQLHAISRDPSVAPRPCLYLLVEGNLLEASSNNEIFRRNYPQEQGAENGGAGGSGNGRASMKLYAYQYRVSSICCS